MDTSRRGLYLLWHCIKYYFLMNLFQDVTEGVSDSKKCLRFRQVLFNPRQTMRILPPARALRFPRVFQNFQPVNAKVHSDYIARAPNATEKVWWHYYPVEETFQGAFTNHNLCCYPTSHSRPSWRTRYRGSRPSATRAYRSRCDWEICRATEMLHFNFLNRLMKYPASPYLRYQHNNQWRHLFWSFIHTDYAIHKKKTVFRHVGNNVWYLAIAKFLGSIET